jgi:transcription-repair coupling factor (superfamily II helicase)
VASWTSDACREIAGPFGFLGDEIEAIRRFDPATQRTVETLEEILITPAREYISRDAELAIRKAQNEANPDEPVANIELSEFHIPLLHEQPASLLDYLPQKALVLVDDLSVVESMVAEVEEQALKLRQESIAEGILPSDFPLPYVTWPNCWITCTNCSFWSSVIRRLDSPSPFGRGDRGEGNLRDAFSVGERFAGRLKTFIEHLARLVSGNETVIVVSRQSERLNELWKDSQPES